MKHLPLIAIALLFSFPAFSFADNYKVLGNYKELHVVVEELDKNSVGVTRKNLERTVKLRLMKNGIKPITDTRSKHYLYLRVNIMDILYPIKAIGVAVKLDITLQKYSSDYVSADHGASRDHVPTTILSSHDGGLALKTSKAGVLEVVEEEIDTFILKYLEANME